MNAPTISIICTAETTQILRVLVHNMNRQLNLPLLEISTVDTFNSCKFYVLGETEEGRPTFRHSHSGLELQLV